MVLEPWLGQNRQLTFKLHKRGTPKGDNCLGYMKNHSRWPNGIWSSRVHWKDNLRERCTRAKGDINKKWSGLSQSGKDDHKVEEKTCKAKGKTHKASQGKGELAQECWQTPQCSSLG